MVEEGVPDSEVDVDYIQEDLEIAEDSGEEDDLDAKIAEEHGKFKVAQAQYQEKVRASRPWSAPPLGSPRPDQQRYQAQYEPSDVLGEQLASVPERKDYTPPAARPDVERAAAKGGPPLSYMAPPRPMSADATGRHRLSYASGSKVSGCLQNIMEDSILDDKASVAIAAASIAAAAVAAAVSMAALADEANATPSPEPDTAAAAAAAATATGTATAAAAVAAAAAAAETEEDIYDDIGEDDSEDDSDELSAQEQDLVRKLQELRIERDAVGGGSSDIPGLADLELRLTKKLAALRAIRQGENGLGGGLGGSQAPPPVAFGWRVGDDGETGDIDEEPTASLLMAAAVDLSSEPSSPARTSELLEVTANAEGACAQQQQQQPAVPALPLSFVFVPTAGKGGSPLRTELSLATSSTIEAASGDDDDGGNDDENDVGRRSEQLSDFGDLLHPHAFALQLLAHDLRTLPAQRTSAGRAANGQPGAARQADLGQMGYLGMQTATGSRPGSAPAQKRPSSAAPAAARGVSSALRKTSAAPLSRRPATAAAAIATGASSGSMHRCNSGNLPPEAMLQVSHALRTSLSMRDRATAELPQPAVYHGQYDEHREVRTEQQQRQQYKQPQQQYKQQSNPRDQHQPSSQSAASSAEARSKPRAGMARQRPASARPASYGGAAFGPNFGRSTIQQISPTAGGSGGQGQLQQQSQNAQPKRWRPMSAQPHYSGNAHKVHGLYDASVWSGNSGGGRSASPPAAVRTAAVEVSGHSVSVYIADTAKRISEANRCMALLGSLQRYQLKDAKSNMHVLLVQPGDCYYSSQEGGDEDDQQARKQPVTIEVSPSRVVKTLPLRRFLLALGRLRLQAAEAAERFVAAGGGMPHRAQHFAYEATRFDAAGREAEQGGSGSRPPGPPFVAAGGPHVKMNEAGPREEQSHRAAESWRQTAS